MCGADSSPAEAIRKEHGDRPPEKLRAVLPEVAPEAIYDLAI
jgi:hypothetical protein